MRVAAVLLALALAAATAGAQAALPDWAAAGRTVTIPVREASGDVAQMSTTWFLPPQ